MDDSSGRPLAGPIPTSDGLRKLFRLRRALAELYPGRNEELEPVAHDVGLAFIEQVEQQLGVTLPYDVITLATLRIPLFQRATGLSVAHFQAIMRERAVDFSPPAGWIAVASLGANAMQADVPVDQSGFDMLLSISATARDRTGDPEVRIVDGPGPSRVEKLSAFARERIARRYSNSDKWQEAQQRARDDRRPLEDAYLACFVDDRPAAPGPAERVAHPKFGEGTVLRALEDDKLEIAFDTGETKTLLRKFVRSL
jgi:hypothetical protein